MAEVSVIEATVEVPAFCAKEGRRIAPPTRVHRIASPPCPASQYGLAACPLMTPSWRGSSANRFRFDVLIASLQSSLHRNEKEATAGSEPRRRRLHRRTWGGSWCSAEWCRAGRSSNRTPAAAVDQVRAPHV